MTWPPPIPKRYLQLDDRVAVDPHEVALVAAYKDGATVWLKGAAGPQGIYVDRPLAEVIHALDEARRPKPRPPGPIGTPAGGAAASADKPPTS